MIHVILYNTKCGRIGDFVSRECGMTNVIVLVPYKDNGLIIFWLGKFWLILMDKCNLANQSFMTDRRILY